MTRFILAMLATISLAFYAAATPSSPAVVVLPNPKLLGCQSATCSQLWLGADAAPGAKYPKQLRIDFSDGSTIRTPIGAFFEFPNGASYGLTAVYDKSVRIDDVQASINAIYSQWVYAESGSLPVKMWRITQEKFVISLGTCKNDEPGCDAGMVELIYLPIATKSIFQHPQ